MIEYELVEYGREELEAAGYDEDEAKRVFYHVVTSSPELVLEEGLNLEQIEGRMEKLNRIAGESDVDEKGVDAIERATERYLEEISEKLENSSEEPLE